jgi:hypothetical protein
MVKNWKTPIVFNMVILYSLGIYPKKVTGMDSKIYV